jgi:type VI secretion system protein ImpL
MPLYASGLAGRYPLAKGSSKEITLQDFGRFFAPNGIVDTFVSTYLKNNPSVNLSSSMQTQLRYAEKIQQIFFQNGGQTPAVKFNLKPISLDSKASKFWLIIEGQRSEFVANNPAKSAPFQWPGTDASRSVSFGFDTVDGRKLSREEQGAWALFKLLDKLSVQKTVQDSYLINFTIDGVTASYELTASSVDNPFSSSVLQAIKFSQSLY